jgi:hypothetical protein
MNDNVAYSIRIMKDGLVEIDNTGATNKSSKTTDLNSFISLFSSINRVNETPILPFGCRKIVSTQKNDLIIIEAQQRQYDINYEGTIYRNVLVPRSLWFMYLKKGAKPSENQLYKTNIYALDPLTPFNMNMPLKKWIFNNHSTSGYYGVCWGSNNIQNIVSGEYSNFGSLINVYLTSRFNNHLEPYDVDFNGFLSSALDNVMAEYQNNRLANMERILVGLREKTMFPSELLVGLPRITPQTIINDFIGGVGTV